MKTFGLLLLSVCLFAQTSWKGHTTGFVYFGFTGSGSNGPNIFTTATGTDGLTWANDGGDWTDYKTKPASGIRIPYQINAPDAISVAGIIYVHVATANDANLSLVPWIVGRADSTTGIVTTIASVDWTSNLAGVTTCFAGGWVRNADGTPWEGDGNIHLHVPCSIAGLASFKVYETHASPSDLTTWSAPVDVAVNQANMTDPQAYLIGSTFWLWLKDETGDFITLASSSAVTGPFTMVKTGDWAGWGSGMEGPFMYRPVGGTGWNLIFEAFATTHLMYFSTCSTDDPTACTWAAKTLWTQDQIYRHGSVMKLP